MSINHQRNGSDVKRNSKKSSMPIHRLVIHETGDPMIYTKPMGLVEEQHRHPNDPIRRRRHHHHFAKIHSRMLFSGPFRPMVLPFSLPHVRMVDHRLASEGHFHLHQQPSMACLPICHSNQFINKLSMFHWRLCIQELNWNSNSLIMFGLDGGLPFEGKSFIYPSTKDCCIRCRWYEPANFLH